MNKEAYKRRWTQKLAIEPANTENILKNHGIVIRKRQQKLSIKRWTETRSRETAIFENILKTRG